LAKSKVIRVVLRGEESIGQPHNKKKKGMSPQKGKKKGWWG